MKRRAFTLIELLVVVSIIALLVSILMPALGRARQQTMKMKCQTQMRAIGQAFVGYMSEKRGFFPQDYFYNNPGTNDGDTTFTAFWTKNKAGWEEHNVTVAEQSWWGAIARYTSNPKQFNQTSAGAGDRTAGNWLGHCPSHDGTNPINGSNLSTSYSYNANYQIVTWSGTPAAPAQPLKPISQGKVRNPSGKVLTNEVHQEADWPLCHGAGVGGKYNDAYRDNAGGFPAPIFDPEGYGWEAAHTGDTLNWLFADSHVESRTAKPVGKSSNGKSFGSPWSNDYIP